MSDSSHFEEMRHHAGEHQEVVGGKTIRWAGAGLGLGSFLGLAIGVAMGYGAIAIPGLAPIVAGGAGVPGFIAAVFFGSVFGLIGALLGTRAEAHPNKRVSQARDTHHKRAQHGVSPLLAGKKEVHGEKASFIQKLPVLGAMGLALFMAYTLYVTASAGFGSGETSDQSNRITWNQKNVSRVGGETDAETGAFALQTAYPATRPGNRPGFVVVTIDDWRAALAATPLISRPLNAAVVVTGPDGPGTGMLNEMQRLGSPWLLSIGAVQGAGSSETIDAGNPAAIAAAIDERLAAATGSFNLNVIIVNQDANHGWALPAGAYAARTGTPILFVANDGIPPETDAALRKRSGGKANLFILGSSAAVPSETITKLGQYGKVTRIEGGNVFENAVRFAEFRDESADFGWGHTGKGYHQTAVVNSILVNTNSWQDGIYASHLARAGKPGPLLFVERDRIPAVVDNHLWRQRPVFASTPAEGPFNHIWAVGSFDQISYKVQAWADYSQEIEQYMTLGDSAVSGFEALGIGWVILSIACSAWIVYHSRKRLPDVMPVMKAAWAIFALLLGPLALVLYIKSYNKRQKMSMNGMVMWHRPMWAQVVSATVMMFSFDMMLMVLAVFFVAYFGFPIIRMNGPLYWLGSSMFLMMALMYVIALVAMMFIFHTPMTMHERKIPSYWKAFAAGFPIMLATMTVESIGMMPTMWWAQMLYLPAMQMPTEDDFTMWATLLLAVFVGFLVVLPFNYWMVKSGRKMGTM